MPRPLPVNPADAPRYWYNAITGQQIAAPELTPSPLPSPPREDTGYLELWTLPPEVKRLQRIARHCGVYFLNQASYQSGDLSASDWIRRGRCITCWGFRLVEYRGHWYYNSGSGATWRYFVGPCSRCNHVQFISFTERYQLVDVMLLPMASHEPTPRLRVLPPPIDEFITASRRHHAVITNMIP